MNIGRSTQHRSDRMSGVVQTRASRLSCGTSALPPRADMQRPLRHVRFVPIVLKKSFLADDGNFLEPLMRFSRRDVRAHIGSHKNDHGPSYPSYRALQRRTCLEINFREIFGVARFSTFATVSAISGSRTIRSSSPRASTRLRWSFGQPGLPQSFFVSQKVFALPRARQVFEIGDT